MDFWVFGFFGHLLYLFPHKYLSYFQIGGTNPLDSTPLHPESYPAAQSLSRYFCAKKKRKAGEEKKRGEGKGLEVYEEAAIFVLSEKGDDIFFSFIF